MTQEKFKGSFHEQLVKDGIIADDFDARLQKQELNLCYAILLRNSGFNEMTQKVDSKSRLVKIKKDDFERFTFLDHQRLFIYHSPDSEKETARKIDKVFSKKFGKDWKEKVKDNTLNIVVPAFKTAAKRTTESK